MTGFNLSDWALRHRSLVVFFMIVCAAAGVDSYLRLGREEDPAFAVNTMVVKTLWPGATTADMMAQVTDRLEKKLQETPSLDYLKSYTKPGESVVYVNVLDSTNPKVLGDIWYQVRKKVADIHATLPSGTQGPYFNDEFGDVYGVIYGLTFDGFSLREVRDFAEQARTSFLAQPDVAKVDIFGAQDEKFYLTISPKKLAALQLNLNDVLTAIANQNVVVPAGVMHTDKEEYLVEVSGALVSANSLKQINLFINGRFYKLNEIALVQHGYADPPQKLFQVNGRQAVGLGISMRAGGNVLRMGEDLKKIAAGIEQRFPIGLDLSLVSDQPQVVSEAIGGFTKALKEAVVIVLGVSFISLGLRAGLVVACSIPLVLAIVFLGMEMMGTSLQRISLGALIIALGLLVDDAMITVEMMIAKIEEGYDKAKAATFAYTSVAFPMLTGTLVTAFGFLPIGFARSGVGQYCFSLFSVVLIALLISWIVAVVFSPLIGVFVLPAKLKSKHGEGKKKQSILNRIFRVMIVACMRFRYVTIVVTLVLFGLSLYATKYVQQQFFPASDRPELLVTMTLNKNASIFAARSEAARFTKLLEGDPTIERYSSYVGGGAIRFYLPLDVQLDNSFLAQFVIVAKGLAERDALLEKLSKALDADFPEVTGRVSRLELGPPVGWPVQYRVSAETTDQVRAAADRLARILRASPYTSLVNFDWGEKTKTIRLAVNQDAVRKAGLSSEEVSRALNMILSGVTVTQIRDSIYLIDVVARAPEDERLSLKSLQNLQLSLGGGRSTPLAQLATIEYTLSEGYMWRRDRLPTITVQADVVPGIQPPTAYAMNAADIDALRKTLPPGVQIVEGGTVESSAKANASIVAQLPLMALLMLVVLMFQLQSFQRLFLVLSVAPLGVIGVVVALLLTHTPMGFVSILGIIALIGMIIRNSVILIDQIEHFRAAGKSGWDAVIDAADHRLRPIMLTAAAAILGMIPIMHDVFWGPMAYAIVGGLTGATLLTMLFLPALYVAWFRIKETHNPEAARPAGDALQTAVS
ncbi:MAG TPA: efflux RND transporter permease subunit [Dongiaceae bacterium]|nr:efflux RND transporter permease subunit [Dongiaceae bacterium]